MKVQIEVQGLAQLQAKLEPKTLYWQPVKEALDALGKAGAQQATRESASFRNTGALSAGMTHRLNAKPMPLWVVVTTSAVGKTGRRYPWILEFESKYGHKNWLRDAVKRAQANASQVLSAAVAKIESKWGS